MFSPDSFSGCIKNEENQGNTQQQKTCWYSTVTADICDSWLKAEIDPHVRKATLDSNNCSTGEPILLYEAFKRFASQWVSSLFTEDEIQPIIQTLRAPTNIREFFRFSLGNANFSRSRRR